MTTSSKFTIEDLSHITVTVSITSPLRILSCRIQSHCLDSRLHPTFQEPVIQIDAAALDSWRQDQLANADALLTAAIPESQSPSHHVLASRALVRARLQQWDAALIDAEKVLVDLLSPLLILTLVET